MSLFSQTRDWSPTAAPGHEDGSVDDTYDFQCALMSLPLRFNTVLSSIPNKIPYLKADEELVARWKARIGEHGFKIGIAWQGNPRAPIDQGRSIPLAEFAPWSFLVGKVTDADHVYTVTDTDAAGNSSSGLAIYGQSTGTTLTGGTGNDAIYGNSGNDTLIGGAGPMCSRGAPAMIHSNIAP